MMEDIESLVMPCIKVSIRATGGKGYSASWFQGWAGSVVAGKAWHSGSMWRHVADTPHIIVDQEAQSRLAMAFKGPCLMAHFCYPGCMY